MKGHPERKDLCYRIWLKVLMVLIMFLPLYTEKPYNPADTTKVIAGILMTPLIAQIRWLLPIAKGILLAAVLSPLFLRKSERAVLGWYAVLLVSAAFFQNMGTTEYGFSFIPGNLIDQLLVTVWIVFDLIRGKTRMNRSDFQKENLWLLPFMVLAFLMPYAMENGILRPSINNVLINEAGVTYCMFTPVITGTLLLFEKRVYRPTLYIISFLGLGFGILNMITWFVFDLPDWWMGICHIPLMVISIRGMTAGRKKTIEV